MSKQRDPFIPLPNGEVYTYTPDGAVCADGNSVSSNLQDAMFVDGARGTSFGGEEFNRRHAGDVTGLPPRKPDYGGY